MEKKAEKTVVFHENGAHLFHGKFQCMYGLQHFLPVYGGLFSTEFQISQYGKIPAVTDQAAAAVCMLGVDLPFPGDNEFQTIFS